MPIIYIRHEILDLGGKDECERVTIDQISELWRDYVDATSPYIGVSSGYQEGDRVRLII